MGREGGGESGGQGGGAPALPPGMSLLAPGSEELAKRARYFDRHGDNPADPRAFGLELSYRHAKIAVVAVLYLFVRVPAKLMQAQERFEAGRVDGTFRWFAIGMNVLVFVAVLLWALKQWFGRRVFLFEPTRMRYRYHALMNIRERDIGLDEIEGMEYRKDFQAFSGPWRYKAVLRLKDGSRIVLSHAEKDLDALEPLVDVVCRWADLSLPELPDEFRDDDEAPDGEGEA